MLLFNSLSVTGEQETIANRFCCNFDSGRLFSMVLDCIVDKVLKQANQFAVLGDVFLVGSTWSKLQTLESTIEIMKVGRRASVELVEEVLAERQSHSSRRWRISKCSTLHTNRGRSLALSTCNGLLNRARRNHCKGLADDDITANVLNIWL